MLIGMLLVSELFAQVIVYGSSGTVASAIFC